MRQLDETTLISGQIAPADLPQIKAQGVTMIVNNRADGEEPGQPLSGDIEAAAEDAGIEFRFIPISRGIGPAEVECMQEAIRDVGEGKLLAFCRSGNRSALAWAVAQSEEGMPREEIERCATRAGIDLAPVAHLL